MSGRLFNLMGGILLLGMCVGCASTRDPRPIAYVAVERPVGAIMTNSQPPVSKAINRGGFYVGNYNFRPAPDIAQYLTQVKPSDGSGVIRDADVKLTIPFALDILMFGYNLGTDSVRAGGSDR